MIKTCKKCGKRKQLRYFSMNRQGYYNSYCKSCNVTVVKKWIIENPERFNKLQSENYKRLKHTFLDMYGNKCICCEECTVEFLTIEHVNGQTKETKESTHSALRRATKIYDPKTYVILCMNCNHSKGRYGYCPHEKRR